MAEEKQPKVLVLEYDSDHRTIFEALVQKAGCEAISVGNATKTWDFYQEQNQEQKGGFSLLLAGMINDPVNCSELIRKVRKDSPELPILACTAQHEGDLAREAGADYVLENNYLFDNKALIGAIGKAIKRE